MWGGMSGVASILFGVKYRQNAVLNMHGLSQQGLEPCDINSTVDIDINQDMMDEQLPNDESTYSDENYMAIHTDFEKAFQEGYSFQYEHNTSYYQGSVTIEFSVSSIGELILTSGQLLACDPGIIDIRYPFTKQLTPNRYPVLLSLAGFKETGERYIACAMLQITQEKPIRWELAVNIPNYPIKYQGYSVDSGTGCFMDLDAARILEELKEESYDRIDREFYQPTGNKMLENMKAAVSDKYPYDWGGDWANVRVGNTEANVIAFSTGGDGGFASYWGYDSNGNVACLVTDLMLFYDVANMTKELF